MIRFFIDNGIVVAVMGVALLMFGLLSLFRLPIQLTPNVETPVITVSTFFPGATPEDVEQDIIIEQEKFLKGIPGLEKMTSTASLGQGEIILEFALETEQQENIIRVNNALAQVPSYPENVDEPSISTDSADDQPIAWFAIKALPDRPDVDIRQQFDYLEDTIKPRFERIPGVSGVRGVFGSSEKQMQVMIDPVKLADRGITIFQVREAIRGRNRDVSGGDLDEGKRRFNVRTLGRYETAQDIEDTIITYADGAPIYIRDVGYARMALAEQRSFIRYNSERALAMGIKHQRGTNMLVVMEDVKALVKEVNEDVLKERGIQLIQATDDTQYVNDAVRMVRANLLIGGVLAILTLLVFLRNVRTTLILAVSIPLCIIGSFFLISSAGRSINVISLAGLAFSIGVVLDASIVVLENIFRHHQMDKEAFKAAEEGTNEVWTAILSSTLTNVVVFTPIIWLKGEAGQLFRDIAIAIVSANVLALIVSIIVIPPLAARLMRGQDRKKKIKKNKVSQLENLWGLTPIIANFHEKAGGGILRWMLGGTLRRLGIVFGTLGFAFLLIFLFLPETEYLPNGNQQTVFAFISPPQGYGLPELERIANRINNNSEDQFRSPLENFESGNPDTVPIKDFFVVAFGTNMFIFSRPIVANHVDELIQFVSKATSGIPGTFAFVTQMSIFGNDLTGARGLDIDITGTDLLTLAELGGMAQQKIMMSIPGIQYPRAEPGTEIGQPEISIEPNWERAAELGINSTAIGYGAWVLGDGAYADEFYLEGDKVDLYLYSTLGAFETLDQFESLRISTGSGDTVPLSEVADVKFTFGPQQVRRVNQQRAVTLKVQPPPNISLEETINIIERDVIGEIRASGAIPEGSDIRIAGASDKLSQIRERLSSDFILALILSYMTMVLVFHHWGHPFTVMLTVPIGLTGGVLGLWFLNVYLQLVTPGFIQSLDVLTMLGFVILLGSVINNPILIVQQSLNFIKQGLDSHEAIVQATLSRVRPILMTTGTTIFGLMPLVLNPGAGSELYRGMGVVMFGGLILGTFTTTFFMPAVVSLLLDFSSWWAARNPHPSEPETEIAEA